MFCECIVSGTQMNLRAVNLIFLLQSTCCVHIYFVTALRGSGVLLTVTLSVSQHAENLLLRVVLLRMILLAHKIKLKNQHSAFQRLLDTPSNNLYCTRGDWFYTLGGWEALLAKEKGWSPFGCIMSVKRRPDKRQLALRKVFLPSRGQRHLALPFIPYLLMEHLLLTQ